MNTNQHQKPNFVLGRITDFTGKPIENLVVEIYDQNLRSGVLLAETSTNKNGQYKTSWQQSQLSGPNLRTADLALKVYTPKKRVLVYASPLNKVRFNASPSEVIDVALQEPIQDHLIEFDELLKEVTYLAANLAIADLQESTDYQDVSFLSKEIGIKPEKIEHLILAHRIQAISKIDPDFFYALLRENTLLLSDPSQNLPIRLSIGLQSPPEPLLLEAALKETDTLSQTVKTAIKGQIVNPSLEKRFKRNLELLQSFKKRAEKYSTEQHTEKILSTIGRFLLDGKVQEVKKLFKENRNDLNAFFDKVTNPAFFSSNARAADVKTSIAMGQLFGFGNEIIPHLMKSRKISKPEDIRKLASLNKTEWLTELTKANGSKAPTAEQKKALSFYASTMVRKMEKAYPTTAYAAQLKREKSTVFKTQRQILDFLNKNEDFNLAKDAIQENQPYSNELKSIQRIFKLTPSYSKTNALLKQNIHSSHQIVAMGKTRFLKTAAPAANIEPAEAKEMFRKAESTNAAAMMKIGELQATLRAADIASLKNKNLSLKLEAVSKDFPNLKSLFKVTDTCACEECRSVYSPAAYLVEILQFLHQRSVTDINTHVTSNIAKDVLFERRPDLGEIDLSCANANTSLPYIDLVCELLEEAIAPDQGINYHGKLSDGPDQYTGTISAALLAKLVAKGLPVTNKAQIFHTEVPSGSSSTTLPHYLRDSKAVCKIETTGTDKYKVYLLRQTLAPEDELAAAPAYVNQKAYDQLKNNTYAFGLPFDLNQVEATAYFSRFDLFRANLMSDFNLTTVAITSAMAAEILGLTDSESTLITTSTPSIAAQQLIWNTPAQWDSPAVSGNVVDYMKRVDHFLDKTGLSFSDLSLLLTLQYIDNSNNLYVYNKDLTCDTSQKEIANLDEKVLDRIHRFLRLQKKTGWKFQTLDSIISQGTAGTIDLVFAATMKKLADQTGLKIDELIGYFGHIYYTPVNNLVPLYQQIFLNKAKNGVIDEGLLPEKVNGSQLLTTYSNSLSICLQMKTTDLEKLYPLLPDATLNFPNLSYLLGASRLIKKLHLKTDDFLILLDMTGINIFTGPQKMLDFINQCTLLQSAPLKPADIQFMLQHQAANLSDRELKEDKILNNLLALQKAYQDNFKANQSKFNPDLSAEEQQATLQGELSKLSVLSDDDVKTILQFLNKVYVTVATAKAFINSKLSSIFDTTNINSALDALDAATGTDKDLVKALLDAISDYQLLSGKQSILQQNLITAFKSDPDTINVVLQYAELKQPAPGSGLLSDILISDTLIDTDPSHVFPVPPALNAAAFPNHYASFRLLHKLFPLLSSFNLSTKVLSFYFQNNSTLNWFTFDSIPYTTGQTVIDQQGYADFVQFLAIDQQYPAIPDPADAAASISFLSLAALLLPGATTTRDQFLRTLSILTGYDQTDLDTIDNYLFSPFNLNNYTKIKTWKRLLQAAANLSILGIELAQALQYIKPVLNDADVRTLRAALKSRYEEDTWLLTLKDIMDDIRPQKRDALVAYLLAINPDIKNTDDLYDYFLVDVEMEAVMSTSRIVQAHGTIQLFVQRCLMGLEPKAAADLDDDASWTQWAWMKNYRVWEANRKIFLYPENWIEAELRDEKSFLFEELEDQLQQNELTAFTAEDALINYLEKLDNLAFLEVMATWYQTDITTMHVFARTKGGDPAKYYYRRFEQERTWTPWEKVDMDITGDQLLAFVRNNRLCLAWPVFTEVHDPNQGSTLPDTADSSEQSIDKPRRKLKIQLAISEFANKQWQPKKVSQDGIMTPDTYVTDDLPTDRYNMIYAEQLQQVQFFRSGFEGEYEFQQISGIFNLTGCKGYPELIFQGSKDFNDFYPDFRDTLLKSQRYDEWNQIPGDDLSVRNGMSPTKFYEILHQTPGNFRLSYPHQFTNIDLLVLLFEYLAMILDGESGGNEHYAYVANRGRKIKLALGTMLPYFMEDSAHAYVIIPGYYQKDKTRFKDRVIFSDRDERTASDIFKLLKDISNFINKYAAIVTENFPTDLTAFAHTVITDPDFQNILTELSAYEGFDKLYDAFIGASGNPEIDKVLKQLRDANGLEYGEEFKNMYHPLVCALRTVLYKNGVPELMKRETQLMKTAFDFKSNYLPNPDVVPLGQIIKNNGNKTLSYPVEDLDFSSDGSYSIYNWELFFHVPFLLATRLTQNQSFEDALTWFNYMFNPTGALSGDAPQKYWVTKPFYLNQDADYIAQRIDTILYSVAGPTSTERTQLEYAIEQWAENPFKPHVIAKFRPVAYQKALLMKYLDNLCEWGDNLFRQDTWEAIGQATQMYILADKILGPKPRIIPPTVPAPYETYNQLERKLDSFGNALINMENMVPDLTVLPEKGKELPPPPVTLAMLYFCIPQNDQMLTYWDTIADRLFKIRNSQNIDGVERSLALFAPPIDPGMLVRAAAAGLDISSVIAGMNAPTPYYRFNVLAGKATELAQEIRGLGNALLQSLEKKDAEAMSLLRSELELKVLNAVRDLKVLQINEAAAQIEVLKRTQLVTQERVQYYGAIEKIISNEQLNLDKLDQAVGWQTAANIVATLGSGLALIPDFALGVSGFGGSPHGAAKFGGSALAHSTDAIAKGLGIFSTIATFEANKASIMGGYDRRYSDWKLQERLAIKESASIDQQITAAQIRKDIATADLKNQDLQIDNTKKTDDFMRSKYTNKELYDWMVGQISSVYFKSYQMAFDIAKKAERCYRFELGSDDTFIAYGYWDSMKKGLQTADKLIYDLKRMETSYIDKNKREYEITKHVSLLQLDPLAILRLRSSGSCDFDIPEALFDLDYAGQYFRRIKSVSISLPCIAGPYTSVSAKLSLVNNRYRKLTNPDNIATTGYTEDPGNDERFVYNVGAIQSIAASNAQNDSGVFELNFKDERYLPFEGTGTISSWRLELPASEIRQFDYNTIADVIVHIKYTSREGGSSLKGLANASLKDRLDVIRQQLSKEGLHVAVNVKHDLPNQWNLLKTAGHVDLTIDSMRLPYMAQMLNPVIEEVMFVAKVTGNPASYAIQVDAAPLNLARVDAWKLCQETSTSITLGTSFNLAISTAPLKNLEELILVVKYSFS
ncbi:hypothetical protein DBR11_22760 [Pedobacter sp. HMWF019]|uniref:Tc toxin subunit A-related protein n=1 Tax=Pedobacter sp. HMWF019 TaxID=2056856 RepID=UPI000D38766F|nr:neuraminidase-like domain-containing protein [Pedobacter sp. HMWF019]PTS94649.1 hypothetical protein DBR11_22760 [Pedobacter sp. HMWF019]